MADALHTDGAVVTAQDARLDDAGLLAVQGPTALDVRTGVLIGPGSRTLVTGTSATAPMTVQIAAHHWITSRGSANGPYRGVSEVTRTVNIGAAPGSGTRIDVVYVKQSDAAVGVPSPDGSTGETYGVLAGTVGAGKPPIATIVGAEEIATVSVSAGATATNGAGVAITNTARQTNLRGGVIPVADRTARLALTTYPTLQALELDTGRQFVHDGTRWRFCGDHVIVATTTDLTNIVSGDLYPGLTAYVTGIQANYVRDNSAWRFLSMPAGAAKLGATAAGITGAGIWTPSTVTTATRLQNLGDGTAYLQVTSDPASGFSVPADGNISNGPIARLPVGWEPALLYTPLQSMSTGRVALGYLTAGSTDINIASVNSGASIAAGEDVELAGIYKLANPLVT